MPKDVHDCVEKLKSKKDFYPGNKDRESIAWGICWNQKKKRKRKSSADAMMRLAQIFDDNYEHEAADIVDNTQSSQFQKYDLSNLRQALESLDFKLTGKSRRATEKPKSDSDILGFLYDSQEYYLNDGGYSRIVLRPNAPDYDTMSVVYTSNSTDAVKAAWESAALERQVVESEANKLNTDSAYQALTML